MARNNIPNIEFDENNIPINLDFGDSYYSKSGGLEETNAVFIDACKLREKFAKQKTIIIGETGFGTGLNLLAVWDIWQNLRRPNAILHFYTFEKFLMQRETAKQALEKWPQLANLAQLLLQKWPMNIGGIQRIWLDTQTALNIIVGDAQETMAKQDFLADAWFLDGFAPRANPDFWGQDIFTQIKRLSKPNVRIGTYTVAKIVRDGLAAVGFEFAKQKGFATKRERLEAWLEDSMPVQQTQLPNPKKIAIIGGGIAGSALVYSLAKRGYEITIFDNDIKGDFKASNNPRGLLMPRLDRTDDELSQLFKHSYLYTIQELQKFEGQGFNKTNIVEFGKTQRDFDKFAIFAQNPSLDSEHLEIDEKQLLHKNAGMAYPWQICEKLRGEIELTPLEIVKINQQNNGFELIDENNQSHIFDYVILANGSALNQLCPIPLPIEGRMGQVSITKGKYFEHNLPLSAGGYSVPFEDGFVFGATFEPVKLDEKLVVTQDGHQRNIENLGKFAPYLSQNIDCQNLLGRTSMRVVVYDKKPIADEIPDYKNMYVLGALGSRGLSMALFLAEIIASKINDEPLPIELNSYYHASLQRFNKQSNQN
jgi:tRNA 5-methylaminomethyl-2-thiouridine biosynthesis bifunctional protein